MSKQKEFKDGDCVLFTPESNNERCAIGIVKGVVGDDCHLNFSDGFSWTVEKHLLKSFQISAGPWINGAPTLAGWYSAKFTDIIDFYRYYSAGFVSVPVWKNEKKESLLSAIKEKQSTQGMSFRRQSPEYATWLRDRNLPVGEVHGE